METQKKLHVYLFVIGGRPSHYCVTDSNLSGVTNEDRLFVHVKDVEVDCTPPEGWDWRQPAVAALQAELVAAREAFAKRTMELNQQINNMLAIEGPAASATTATEACNDSFF